MSTQLAPISTPVQHLFFAATWGELPPASCALLMSFVVTAPVVLLDGVDVLHWVAISDDAPSIINVALFMVLPFMDMSAHGAAKSEHLGSPRGLIAENRRGRDERS